MRKSTGTTFAEYLVVMFVLVVVLVVVLGALNQVREYHNRSSQTMELPL